MSFCDRVVRDLGCPELAEYTKHVHLNHRLQQPRAGTAASGTRRHANGRARRVETGLDQEFHRNRCAEDLNPTADRKAGAPNPESSPTAGLHRGLIGAGAGRGERLETVRIANYPEYLRQMMARAGEPRR